MTDPNVARMRRYSRLLDMFLPSEVDDGFASVLWQAACDESLYETFLREKYLHRFSADLKLNMRLLARKFSAN